MATFTLNVDTAETIFEPNETQNGFVLITIAVSGQRLYRISREGTGLDFYDFYIDLTGLPLGSLVFKNIPYHPELFSATPTPHFPDVGKVGKFFNGEQFKLLYLTPTVKDDPAREIPSYINFEANYTFAGARRPIRFIYYLLINGEPRYATHLGNVAFPGQYPDTSIPIDPTKHINIVTKDDIDYYILRIDSTPGIIITKGIPQTSKLSEVYEVDGIAYRLEAPSGGIQSWKSSSGVKQNGVIVFFTIETPISEENLTFIVEPKELIESVVITLIKPLKYQLLIRPKVGVSGMDLRVTTK